MRINRAQAIASVRIGHALLAISLVIGCASVTPLAVKLGADLISAAANNYSQQYGRQVESLLLAVYSDQVGTKQPGRQGAQSAYPAIAPANAPAQADPYPRIGASSSALIPSVTSSSSGSQPGGAATSSPIVLDVAILAQRASDRAARRTDPVPIQDGEVLRDGGGDPRKGDVVKFSFRTNCDCHVYVIGVDGTGYVARVFPEKSGKPVRANQQYVVPQGTTWYGLDQYKGIEQIFFVASRRPRQDIEKSLLELARTGRPSLARSYRPVREAALPSAATRGLVKVQMGSQSTVSSESGQPYSFTPQAFVAQPSSDDVVVTRWFRHE